jgi:hypothetical protein
MDHAPPPITTRGEFVAALHWGFEAAVARGARQVWCVDRDFAEWPLNDERLLLLLGAWLKLPQRQLILLAEQFELLQALHPRFVAWRRTWSHAITVWSPQEGVPPLPTLLLDDGPTCVHLVDAKYWRGRAESDARSARQWRLEVDAFLQRSEAAFPANSLGL